MTPPIVSFFFAVASTIVCIASWAIYNATPQHYSNFWPMAMLLVSGVMLFCIPLFFGIAIGELISEATTCKM